MQGVWKQANIVRVIHLWEEFKKNKESLNREQLKIFI